MRLIGYILSLLLISYNAFAEVKDSLNNSKKFQFEFSLSGEGIHLFEKADAKTLSQTINANQYFPINDNIIRLAPNDNPLIHSAFYNDFNFKAEAYGLHLDLDLVAEHRGVSYGVFDTKSMIIFPKYYVALDTSFKIFNQKIYFGTNFGNYSNQILYEGLQFYNMDYQAIDVYFGWDKFRLRYHQIGDLTNYIGLKIDEVFNFILSAEKLKLTKDYSADLQFGLCSIAKIGDGSNPSLVHPQWNFSAKVANENLKLYAQYTLRNLYSAVAVSDESGFLLGLSYKFKNEKFKLKSNAEYRFYGNAFNKGYISKDVHYRKEQVYYDAEGNQHYYYNSYDNTIGDNLYPLSFYDKTFSQWAVFTEYQNKDVNALSLVINAEYRIFKDFFAKADLDLNYIKAENLDWFCYPFYNVGLAWQPQTNTFILLSMTNKGMNLDKHYPTFYLYDTPQLMLTIRYDLKVK